MILFLKVGAIVFLIGCAMILSKGAEWKSFKEYFKYSNLSFILFDAGCLSLLTYFIYYILTL